MYQRKVGKESIDLHTGAVPEDKAVTDGRVGTEHGGDVQGPLGGCQGGITDGRKDGRSPGGLFV